METFTSLLPTGYMEVTFFVFMRKLQQLREFGACNAYYGERSMGLLLSKLTKTKLTKKVMVTINRQL